MSKENAKKFAIGTGIGLVLGAIVGILFAPKSGKETREIIKSKATETNAKIREELGKIKKKNHEEVS